MSAADAAVAPVGEDEAEALFAGLETQGLIAAAVSGGRDSMALLRLLARWASRGSPRPCLVALTVDHGLRPEAAGEVARVAAWCETIGVEHHGLAIHGAKPASRIQERAREARYDLMTGWCRGNRVGALVVAHHLEDQAETVVMRLARASGVGGLGGMAPEWARNGVPVVRPLLSVPRARLEATLAAFGQAWIDDPTNDDPAYERTRLRALRPWLDAAGLTPDMIAASAAKLARASAALTDVAGKAFAEAVSIEPAGHGWIDREGLGAMADEIAIRVLARTLDVVGGPASPSDVALERAAGRLRNPGMTGFTLGRCRLSGSGGRVLVVREARNLPRSVLGPGERRVWDDRFAVAMAEGGEAVELGALGRAGFAALRETEPVLSLLPDAAGAVLPGGFRDGALALAPEFSDSATDGRLSVRFLRHDPTTPAAMAVGNVPS